MKAPGLGRRMNPERHLELFKGYLRGAGITPDDYEQMSSTQQEYFKEINRWKSRQKRKGDI